MKILKKYTCELKEFVNGVYCNPKIVDVKAYNQHEAVRTIFKKHGFPQKTLACNILKTVSLKGLNLPDVDYKRLENFISNHPESVVGDDKRYKYKELTIGGLKYCSFFPNRSLTDAFVVVQVNKPEMRVLCNFANGTSQTIVGKDNWFKVYQTSFSTRKGVERYSRVANDPNFDMSRIDAMVNAFELEQKLSKVLSVKEEPKKVRKI